MAARQDAHQTSIQMHEHLTPADCPSCGSDAGFMFLAEQRWPERVAVKMGITPLVTLWRCLTCDTTITVNMD
jgi:hypothetical protein